MSVSFLRESAWMAGVDVHDYVTIALVTVPMVHVAGAYELGSPLDEADQKTTTVTAGGNALLKRGATRVFFVHVPNMTIPPEPVLEGLQLATIFSDSESKTEMTAHRVTAQGESLSTAVAGSFGLLVNCGDPLGAGITIHPSPVVTQPTLGDYLGAVAGVVSSVLLGWLRGKITGSGLAGSARKFIFELVLRMLDLDDVLDELPDPDKVHNLVQRWIDDGFDDAKKQWQEEVKKAQQDRREKKAEEDADWTKRLEYLLKKVGFKKTRWADKGK